MPSPVKAAALEMGLVCSDELSSLEGVDVDLGIVVAYGRIIPSDVLERLAMLNLHFSLLPRWRGAAPVERAILAGDDLTGVCVMAVAPELDTGDVYASASTPVANKTAVELQSELARMGTSLLVDLLSSDLPQPTPQVGEITYAAKIKRSERSLHWSMAAVELERVVRLGGAVASFGGRRLLVRAARCVSGIDAPPGALVDGVVATGDGGLELIEVQPESKRAMAASDWCRGLSSVAEIVLGDGPDT